MPNKTHRTVKNPRLSDNKLADYMSASEQARRGILRSCKYQAITAVIQHNDAKKIIAESMDNGKLDMEKLTAKLAIYEGKITDTPFEEEVKQHNIDYINNVLLLGFDEINGEEFHRCKTGRKLDFNGTEISFFPDMIVARTNKRNNRKIGALNFRYSKSAQLRKRVAEFQSALIFGALRDEPFEPHATPEHSLCQTIDGFNGNVYPAPSNSIYLYNEMKAAGSAIALQWPNIEPPSGAVL